MRKGVQKPLTDAKGSIATEYFFSQIPTPWSTSIFFFLSVALVTQKNSFFVSSLFCVGGTHYKCLNPFHFSFFLHFLHIILHYCMANTIATKIKVWVKIDNNEPEKVEIRSDADVDDLKSELFFKNNEEKRKYYGIFNNEKLSSSASLPHDTTDERPIRFFKIDENYQENNSNDEDVVRVNATHFNAGKKVQLV